MNFYTRSKQNVVLQFAGLEENKRKRFGMNGAMGDLMILGGIAFLVFGGFCFCLL